MYRYINTCTFLFTLHVSSGEAKSPILNNLNITSAIVNKRIVQKGAVFAGNVIAEAALPFSNFALTFARIFGNGKDIPTFALNRNIIDINYAPEDFKAGIGNEDARLNIEELLTKYGYPVEKHQVETEDLYDLSVFRIPSEGLPVFLMHGFTGSAEDYVISGPESGLAYLLANDGFDVWLGNARGNKFSRKHAFLKPSEAKFWDFSFHEIGYYDLPAMIDYILKVTGRKNVRYLGHSQGTTTFFVMASARPEYNKKIKMMIALAPAAFLSNMKSPLAKFAAGATSVIHATAKTTGIYELADSKLTAFLKALFCTHKELNSLLCTVPSLFFMGTSIARLNVTNLPVWQGHGPSGSSIKQLANFGQFLTSGKFRQFDYGPSVNLERYGSREPPDYKLYNIVAPVVLIYSPDDWLVQPKDVEKLASKLSNVVAKYKLPMFNHADFLIAKDFKTSIYPIVHHWFN